MAKAASQDAGNLSQEWVWGPAGLGRRRVLVSSGEWGGHR